MSILRPDHLFEQADKLIVPSAAGRPRQADLRRAVSSAYYGVFHFAMTSLADEFVGSSLRTTMRYALVYRSVDHRGLKTLCEAVQKPASPKYRPFFPHPSFEDGIVKFAAAAVELQTGRHIADYDPSVRFVAINAEVAIGMARSAVEGFRRSNGEQRKTFLTLLLCPPR